MHVHDVRSSGTLAALVLALLLAVLLLCAINDPAAAANGMPLLRR